MHTCTPDGHPNHNKREERRAWMSAYPPVVTLFVDPPSAERAKRGGGEEEQPGLRKRVRFFLPRPRVARRCDSSCRSVAALLRKPAAVPVLTALHGPITAEGR